MLKTLSFGVSLLLSTGAVLAQKKPLDLTVRVQPGVMTYSDKRLFTRDSHTLQLETRKDLLLPAVRWTSDGVTYTTGISPRKIVLRAVW